MANLQIVTQMREETDDDRRRRLRRAEAVALYNAVKDPDDGPFDSLQAWLQDDLMEEARGAERRADPDVRIVAAELAAQAYALVQGWTWPKLEGCLPASTDPIAIEIHRIQTRQKLRFTAREMLRAADQHYEHGGRDGYPEDGVVRNIALQRADDAARLAVLKQQRIGKVTS